MRIAVVTSLYPTAERPLEGVFAERRWSRMAARGHDVRVVQGLPWASRHLGPRSWREIARAAPNESRSGVVVERPRYLHVPRLARANARAFCACCTRRVLAAPRPDVVVADYAWPAGLAAAALRRAGLPFVVHGRGSDVIQVSELPSLRPLLASALRTAGHWCAVSADLVRRMDTLGGHNGHGVLTANGVDLELFAPGDRRAERAALDVPADAQVVLLVGHLIERKDPLLALETFHAWSRTRPEAKLVVIGRGPLRHKLVAEVDRLGLSASVRLLEELPPRELARWYVAADVLLLTTRREGRPNVVLEALASGLPVLATPAGGTEELLAEVPRSLCAQRDPVRLAAALDAILTDPPDPKQLRASVANLSWEAGLDALEGCLSRAVGAERSP